MNWGTVDGRHDCAYDGAAFCVECNELIVLSAMGSVWVHAGDDLAYDHDASVGRLVVMTEGEADGQY